MTNIERKLLKSLVKPSTYAEEVNVTPKCIYQWIKKGKIESVNIDGTLFVKINK